MQDMSTADGLYNTDISANLPALYIHALIYIGMKAVGDFDKLS